MTHQHFTIACEGCGTRTGGCRCMEGGGNLRREGYCPQCKANRQPPAPLTKGEGTAPVPALDLEAADDCANEATHDIPEFARDFMRSMSAEIKSLRSRLSEVEAQPSPLQRIADALQIIHIHQDEDARTVGPETTIRMLREILEGEAEDPEPLTPPGEAK